MKLLPGVAPMSKLFAGNAARVIHLPGFMRLLVWQKIVASQKRKEIKTGVPVLTK